MTNRETTAIALKCFAIYLLSTVLISFLMSLNMFAFRPSPWIWATVSLSLLAGAAVVFVLWKVANSLVSEQTHEPQKNQSTDYDVVLKNILICMGLYFAIHGMAALPYRLGSYNLMAQSASPNAKVELLSLVAPALKIIIGMFLVAKPKQWVRAIRSIGEK